MGKYDKDRHQKELALRYCLAQGMIPCLEVVVPSISELTESPEVLTDIDVLGLEMIADGDLRRLVFDCKNTDKMGAMGRAFWAAGLIQYSGCHGAYVIMAKSSVYNHRISALSINVDLHDERSFTDLAESKRIDFNGDHFYQSAIHRWNELYSIYEKMKWTDEIFDVTRNEAPLARNTQRVFRKCIVSLRKVQGQFDPAKEQHLAVFLDFLASFFILWASMGRDIRRIYTPAMKKEEFAKTVKYYVWGGREAFEIRRLLREKAAQLNSAAELPAEVQEFPAWEKLLHFVGIIIVAPQAITDCVHVCRELSIRCVVGKSAEHDKPLAEFVKNSGRATQFILAATSYLVAACQLPRDFEARVQEVLGEL